MASKYSIEATLRLIDGITKPLEKIGLSGSSVAGGLTKSFNAAEKRLDNFGKNVAKSWNVAKVAIAGAAVAGVAVATKQFIEFDQAARAASAKFKDLDVSLPGYAESLKQIGQAARDVAAVTEFNAVDTAGALDKMAMAGLTSGQSMALLKGTTNLATAAAAILILAIRQPSIFRQCKKHEIFPGFVQAKTQHRA